MLLHLFLFSAALIVLNGCNGIFFLYVASRWHAGLTVMHNVAAPKNRRITMEIHSDMALPVWGMRNGH